jgi:hypothetical protein
MQRFGRTIEISGVRDLKILTGKAFIAPFKTRTFKYLTNEYLSPGFAADKTYLYIGPANLQIDLCPADTVIQTSDRRYYVQKAEKVYFGEKPLYIWAILKDYYED